MKEIRREIAYIDTEDGRRLILYHGCGKSLTAESLDGVKIEEIGYTPYGMHALINSYIYCRKLYMMPKWHYQEVPN